MRERDRKRIKIAFFVHSFCTINTTIHHMERGEREEELDGNDKDRVRERGVSEK
jgi:hypothetical protein